MDREDEGAPARESYAADTRWDRPTLAPTQDPGAPAFDPRPDRFEIGDELGRGGMGRVVAAVDVALDRPVAIKQVLSDRVEDHARFEREAQITARLEHPSIVPIHEVGRDDSGRPYYVMRRIEGKPLSSRADAVDIRDRLALVANVLAAVDAAAFAHASGVIHRDIKPWNILVGAYGETLLIDWGLARRLDEPDDETSTNTSGTPGYMAPEQARGESVDERADVYALGATLFHVLAGAPPYEGSTETALGNAAAGMTPQLARLPPEVPPELVAIVGKATAASRDDRYRDAGALAADLRRFLGGQLVAAHRYTTRQRIARYVRRHRVAVGIAAAAVVALAVVGIVSIAGIVRARDLADEGQRLAAERADQMLLDRASALAAQDPTRAVALLALLPDDSQGWRRARDIAAVAAAHGIARGTASHRGAVTALALSPDGRRLASGGMDGTIQLHDIATGRTHTIATTGARVRSVAWIGDGAIVYAPFGAGLHTVDVASGATLALESSDTVDMLWPRATGLAYHDRTRRTVVERDGRDGPPRIVAQDVTLAARDGERTLVVTSTGVRVVDPAHAAELSATAIRAVDAALSPTGTRAAVADAHEVIEWDLTTGLERQRWPLAHESARTWSGGLFYRGDRLYVVVLVESVVSLRRLSTSGADEIAHGSAPYLPPQRTGAGPALVTMDGAVAVLTDGGLVELANPTSRTTSATTGSQLVAIGAGDGSIRWWDTSLVLPALMPSSVATVCAVDASRVFAVELGSAVAVSRGTGAKTVLGKVGTDLACIGSVVDDHLVTYDPSQPGKAHVTGGKHPSATLPSSLVVVDPFASSIVLADRDRIGEFPRGEPPPVVLWTAPHRITGLSAARGWVAARLDGGTIARIDRGSHQATTIEPPQAPRGIAASPDGSVWFWSGPAIWRWTDHTTLVAMLPSECVDGQMTDAGLAARLGDGSLWLVTPTSVVERVRSGGGHRTSIGLHDVAVTVDDTHVVTTFLATGEQIVRSAGSVGAVAMSSDEHEIAVQRPESIAIYRDPVPADPARLRPWIESMTNAAVEPGRDALTWR